MEETDGESSYLEYEGLNQGSSADEQVGQVRGHWVTKRQRTWHHKGMGDIGSHGDWGDEDTKTGT